jgi:SAM-dependent methyltransferase
VEPTREVLSHFLAVWPLALAKSALRALEAVAFRQLPPVDGSTLDIGCGDGAFGRWVVSDGDLWGVDNDVERLRLAAARGVHALAADAARLPFGPGAFDAVIANSTLEHLADPRAAIREAQRVLRPGGRFAFTVPLQAVLGNLLFGRVAGACYQRQFNDYWQHTTMQSAKAWQAMVSGCAPELLLARSVPIESRRQTETVDLLWSLVVTQGPLIAQSRTLLDAQRHALADLLADLLVRPDSQPDAAEAHSEILLEYIKTTKVAGTSD